MSKTSLTLLGAVVILTTMFESSLVVRAQSSPRIEYLRATPFLVHIPVAANRVSERIGYRACVAGNTDWACREFQPPTESSTDALRDALATLGNDGWELVSAIQEDSAWTGIHGLTFLFKRHRNP